MKMINRSSIHPSTFVSMMTILLIHCVKGQQCISIANTNTDQSNRTECIDIYDSSSDVDFKFADACSAFSHLAWERTLEMIDHPIAFFCTLVFGLIIYLVIIIKLMRKSGAPLSSEEDSQHAIRGKFVPPLTPQERSFNHLTYSFSNSDKFVNTTSKQWTRRNTPSDRCDKIYNMKFDSKKSPNYLPQNFPPRPLSLPPSQLLNNVHVNISGSRMSNERGLRIPVTTFIEQSTVNVVVGDLNKATINMNDLEVQEIISNTKEKGTYQTGQKRGLSTNSPCISNSGSEKSEYYMNSTKLRPTKKRKPDTIQRKLPITTMVCHSIPIVASNNTEGRLGIANAIDPKGQCPRSGCVSPLSFAEVTESSELENSSESTSCLSSLNGAPMAVQSIENLQNSNLSSQNLEVSKTRHYKGNYTLKQFEELWDSALDEMDYTDMEELENDYAVRGGNREVNDMESKTQNSAQYGRLRFKAVQILFGKKFWNITRNDIFVDIGHGIGNAVVQSAYMIGCEARGIELVGDRNDVAEELKCKVEDIIDSRGELNCVGEITLKQGRLEDPENRDFIISPPGNGATKVLVNNFNGVFAERQGCPDKYAHLDLYIAALFAMMVPGSVVVTLHPLIMPPSRSEVNKARQKVNKARQKVNKARQKVNKAQGKLNFSTDDPCASLYELEIITLGEAGDTVSWSGPGNTNKIIVYKYTRLQQNRSDPVFLCSNALCENAKNNTPNAATIDYEQDGEHGIIIDTACKGCNATQKHRRSRITPTVCRQVK